MNYIKANELREQNPQLETELKVSRMVARVKRDKELSDEKAENLYNNFLSLVLKWSEDEFDYEYIYDELYRMDYEENNTEDSN